ncbi:hypothetical protein AVEN_42572-1 [Araneus ventricosus]|uniref:Uncharacterized protein n=1 Tax=Araneus ventricosus TaxID=182803 RepID=A0A4Y2RP63_ARAVE|nr:hypothetical protein AVEN_42572-1 [Araneus ventricosus]
MPWVTEQSRCLSGKSSLKRRQRGPGVQAVTSGLLEPVFWVGPRNLNLNQMTGTAPELAPLNKTSIPHQWEDIWPLWIQRAPDPLTWHFFGGIGFRAWKPPARGRDLTIRSP